MLLATVLAAFWIGARALALPVLPMLPSPTGNRREQV